MKVGLFFAHVVVFLFIGVWKEQKNVEKIVFVLEICK
jgi:hypothetical protein